MPKHPQLSKLMLGGSALIAVGTTAQMMGLGSAACVLGPAASGSLGTAVSELLGFASSFAGGWLSNRFHEKYKTLEYELNDSSDVLRNHYLRRLVTQAIVLGIRQGSTGSIKDVATVRALRSLETCAKALFEEETAIAERLDLQEPQIERFFTGEWKDFQRVPAPSEPQWREFLQEAVGERQVPSMNVAIDIASESLNQHFARLLFDNAKLASESDRPAFAALELMLIRTLATTLARHGQQLNRIDGGTLEALGQLASIKSELSNLRESLSFLPSRLESRLMLPDLLPFTTLHASAYSTCLIAPGAVASVDARLEGIEQLLQDTFKSVKISEGILRGERTLLAKLPLVGEVIKDNANRDWVIRRLLSSGAAGCVALTEYRGKLTIFKVCVIEDFAGNFVREVEATTALQDLKDPDARFCKILDSRLPQPPDHGTHQLRPATLPPFWLQLEYYTLGSLASWWKPEALDPAQRAKHAAAIVANIARTVELAHSRGVLHRDLKPTNILMGLDQVGQVTPIIADFGIASFSDPERSAATKEHAGSRTLHTKGIDAAAHQGTWLYMAPELYERMGDNRPPAPPSVVTDVYSLGMILYWLLSGREERPTRELVQAHIDDRTLGYIVRRATHREAYRRYSSAAELAQELDTRTTLPARLADLEYALLTDADRLALQKERLQASEQQRLRAEKERERAESQTNRAVRLVRHLRWAAAGLVVLAVLATVGFAVSANRAEGERLAKTEAESQAKLAREETARAQSESRNAKIQSIISQATTALDNDPFHAAQVLREVPVDSSDLRLVELATSLLQGPLCQMRVSGELGFPSVAEALGTTHHMGPGPEVSVTKDGRYAVFISGGTDLHFLDLGNNLEERRFAGHSTTVTSAAIAADGSKIAAGAYDGTVCLWSIDGSLIRRIRIAGRPEAKPSTSTAVRTLQFSSGSTHLLAATSESATLFRLDSGIELGHFPFEKADDDGMRLSADPENVMTRSRTVTVCTPGAWLSPEDDFVVTLSSHGRARWWDADKPSNSIELLPGTINIEHVTISPDGKRIAAACNDYSARVWHLQPGPVLENVFEGHTSWLNVVAFSPDSSLLASGANDGTCRIWDVHGQVPPRVWDAECGWINDLSFSPDADQLAVAGSQTNAQVWNLLPSRPSVSLKAPGNHVCRVLFTSSPYQVVVQDQEQTLSVWDIDPGVQPKTFIGKGGQASDVSTSSDGQTFLSFNEHQLHVWRIGCGAPLVQLETQSIILTASFGTNDKEILAFCQDQGLRIWALPNTEPIIASWSDIKISSVRTRLNGTTMLLENSENRLMMLHHRADSTTLVPLLDATDPAALVSEDSRFVAYPISESAFRVVDVVRRSTVYEAHLPDAIRSASLSLISHDGTRLGALTSDGDFVCWTVGVDSTPFVVRQQFPTACYEFLGKSADVLIGTKSGEIVRQSLGGAREKVLLGKMSGPVSCIVSSNDGALVVAGSAFGEILICDVNSPSKVINLPSHSGEVRRLILTENARSLVSVDDYGETRIHSLKGKDDWSMWLRVVSPTCKSLDFSRERGNLACAFEPDTVRLRGADGTWATLHASAESVMLSAGNGQLATLDSESVTVWWLDQDRPVDVYRLPEDVRLVGAAISSDAERIFTYHSDGSVHLWLSGHSSSTPIWTDPKSDDVLAMNIGQHRIRWNFDVGAMSGGSDMFLKPAAFRLTPDEQVVGFLLAGKLRLLDLKSPANPTYIEDPTSEIRSFAFSPDSKRVAIGTENGSLSVVTCSDPTSRVNEKISSWSIRSVTWSPDGHWIAIDSGSTLILAPADQIHGAKVLASSQGGSQALAFDSESNLLADASKDGAAKLWTIKWSRLRESLWTLLPQRLTDVQREKVLGFAPMTISEPVEESLESLK